MCEQPSGCAVCEHIVAECVCARDDGALSARTVCVCTLSLCLSCMSPARRCAKIIRHSENDARRAHPSRRWRDKWCWRSNHPLSRKRAVDVEHTSTTSMAMVLCAVDVATVKLVLPSAALDDTMHARSCLLECIRDRDTRVYYKYIYIHIYSTCRGRGGGR